MQGKRNFLQTYNTLLNKFVCFDDFPEEETIYLGYTVGYKNYLFSEIFGYLHNILGNLYVSWTV